MARDHRRIGAWRSRRSADCCARAALFAGAPSRVRRSTGTDRLPRGDAAVDDHEPDTTHDVTMKVALVFDDTVDRPGGVAHYVQALSAGLHDAGHEVELLVGES